MVDRRFDMLVGGGDLLGGGNLHIAFEVADIDERVLPGTTPN
jgi:hypothetical protein